MDNSPQAESAVLARRIFLDTIFLSERGAETSTPRCWNCSGENTEQNANNILVPGDGCVKVTDFGSGLAMLQDRATLQGYKRAQLLWRAS
ncbi:hypothetical protein PC121_g21499 [Phytophthora cactorum]|nr:hypothetical protein PC121_g21499 [Phytophthora cactorum]